MFPAILQFSMLANVDDENCGSSTTFYDLCHESLQLFEQEKYGDCTHKIAQCIQQQDHQCTRSTHEDTGGGITNQLIDYLYLLNNYNVAKRLQQDRYSTLQSSSSSSSPSPKTFSSRISNDAHALTADPSTILNFEQLNHLCQRVYGRLFLEGETRSTATENNNDHESASMVDTMLLKLRFLLVYTSVSYHCNTCCKSEKECCSLPLEHFERRLSLVLDHIASIVCSDRKHHSNEEINLNDNDNHQSNFSASTHLQYLIQQSFSREFNNTASGKSLKLPATLVHNSIEEEIDSDMNNGESVNGNNNVKLHEQFAHILSELKHDGIRRRLFRNVVMLETFFQLQVLLCRCLFLVASRYLHCGMKDKCIELLLLNSTDGTSAIHGMIQEISRFKAQCTTPALVDYQWLVNSYSSLIQQSYLLISLSYYFKRDHTSALSYCSRANQLSNNRCASSLFLQGLVLYESGALLASRQWFERCIEQKSQYLFESLNMMGVLCSKAGESIKSLQFFQRALEVAQTSIDVSTDSRIVLFHNISIQYGLMNNWELQRKMLEVLWRTATLDQSSTRRSNATTNQSQLLSIPMSSSSLSNQVPNTVQIMYSMAQCHLHGHSYEFALNAYQFLFEVIVHGKHRDKYRGSLSAEQSVTALKEYAYLLLETRDYVKAESMCSHILRSHPDDIDTLLLKADAIICQERGLEEANTLLHRCQSLLVVPKPQEHATSRNTRAEQLVLVLNNCAIVHVCHDNVDGAIDQLNRALDTINRTSYDMSNSEQLRTNVTYNLCLLYRRKQMFLESRRLWLSLRPLSFNALSYDSCSQMLSRLKQQQVELGTAQIMSHVCGTVSRQQLLQMDIEVVSHLLSQLESRS